MKYYKSFINLLKKDKKEVYFLFQAFFYLLFIKYKLCKHNFNYLSKDYKLKSINNDFVLSPPNNDILKTLKSIGWAVERISLLLPWDGLCLVKALATQRILLKYNLLGIIYMGVKKDNNTNELKAHAWLKYNDIFLTGRLGHHEFTVVSTFTWDIK